MKELKVEKKLTINNSPVTLEAEFEGIYVYKYRTANDARITLYFTKNDKVIKILHIEADCSQDYGYIDNCEFKDI